MALHLARGENQVIPLQNGGYFEERSSFSLADEAGREFFVPYHHPHQEGVPYGQYFVSLWMRSAYAENDIFEIYDAEGAARLGWIFPLQALRSDHHDQAQNVTFLRFAQAAFYELCNGISNAFVTTPVDQGVDEIDITSFYSEDSIVLILYKRAFADPDLFRLDDYIPCLFKFGYFLQSSSRNPAEIAAFQNPTAYEALDQRLRVAGISEHLKANPFIRAVLVDHLPYERSGLLSFFYLYQLVELLLDRIMQIEQQKFVAIVAERQMNSMELKDAIDSLGKTMSEKARLQILFSHNLDTHVDETDLRRACNEFLRTQPGTLAAGAYVEVNEFWQYLYRVRNALFHNLRGVDPAAIARLPDICLAFKKVISEVLISYKETP